MTDHDDCRAKTILQEEEIDMFTQNTCVKCVARKKSRAVERGYSHQHHSTRLDGWDNNVASYRSLRTARSLLKGAKCPRQYATYSRLVHL